MSEGPLIDPILSLAITIHSSKGCYAALLGSGISRSAAIPTGWEVILDLSRRLATLRGEDCEPDPAAWFKRTFGKDPDYADLLDQLAKSPTERSQLLRPYFEPSKEEREEGRKLPTPAHRAIAKLAQEGFIKVVVTTNFDRLMEMALEEVGVVPQVIASPDAAEGALPLAHVPCTVVKVHGDYLDTRIKNAPHELEQYDHRINQLLDRIFDEYGLIVGGWSAEWDVALRAALERCKGHRFTTYWTARGALGEFAKRIVSHRRAVVISIKGADGFFTELAEKVISLDEISQPHPLSAKVAVATLKRYLADDRHNVRLSDLVEQEVERAHNALTDSDFLAKDWGSAPESIQRKLDYYLATIDTPLHLFVHGCRWARSPQTLLWVRCLERSSSLFLEKAALIAGPDLTRLSPLLLLYAGGIAALVAENYELFNMLLTRTQVRERSGKHPAGLLINSSLEISVVQRLPGFKDRHTPLSDYLHGVLRGALREIEPDDQRYDYVFDRFEYLGSLVCGHLTKLKTFPIGRFGWRCRHPNLENMIEEVQHEMDKMHDDWPPLKAGMFDSDYGEVFLLKQNLDKKVEELSWR